MKKINSVARTLVRPRMMSQGLDPHCERTQYKRHLKFSHPVTQDLVITRLWGGIAGPRNLELDLSHLVRVRG